VSPMFLNEPIEPADAHIESLPSRITTLYRRLTE
jgi:hypothetical protein